MLSRNKFYAGNINACVENSGGEGKGLLAKASWSLQVWSGAHVVLCGVTHNRPVNTMII